MLGRLRHARLSALALALYALATLVVGFAHKPIAGQSVAHDVTHDLVALAAQGEVPLALCDTYGAPARPQVDHACDACALTSAPGLPPTNECGLRAPYGRSVALGIEQRAQFTPAALHAPSSRGPPAA